MFAPSHYSQQPQMVEIAPFPAPTARGGTRPGLTVRHAEAADEGDQCPNA